MNRNDHNDAAYLLAENSAWSIKQLNALAVGCKSCGAAPGFRCVWGTGHSKGKAHAPRVRLAEKRGAEFAPVAETRENSVELIEEAGAVKVYAVVRAGYDFVVSVETGDKVSVTVEAAEGSEPTRAAKMGARRMARKAATGASR